MFSFQHTLFRFALALFGLLLSLSAIYAGIGWIVWARPAWCMRCMSADRYLRLNEYYAHAMATLFPADTDGDGASDGLEMFLSMDPRDPRIHPGITFHWPPPRLAVEASTIDDFHDRPRREIQIVMINERHRVSGRVQVVNAPYAIPKGFRVWVRGCSDWLLALPGGDATEGDLLVPVERDGTVTFDVQPTAQAASRPGHENHFQIETVVTSESLATFSTQCLWPVALPPQEPEIDEVLPKDRVAGSPLSALPDQRVYRVRWPSVTTRSEAVLIEASDPESAAPWSPVALLPSTESVCDFVDVRQYPTPVVRPWLRFRAVPVRYSGPPGSGH